MDTRTRNQKTQHNFLTRGLTIPAWLLALVALLAILAAVMRIAIPAYVWVLIIIIFLVLGLISTQSNPPPGRSVELSDKDEQREYRMIFSDLPDDVNPRLLPIEDRQKLRLSPRDKEIGDVLSVAGDIAFFDNNNRLVSSFARPVKLTLKYTDQDEETLQKRTEMLILNGRLAKNEKAELIPAYLYSPVFKTKPGEEGKIEQASETLIWMPFQNFTRDDANQTLTVEFMFWGDQPIGPSTKP